MIKSILKVLWIIIAIACVLLTVYFLFSYEGSGINSLKSLFSDGFFNGIKDFFVEIWNGFKHVVGLQ